MQLDPHSKERQRERERIKGKNAEWNGEWVGGGAGELGKGCATRGSCWGGATGCDTFKKSQHVNQK